MEKNSYLNRMLQNAGMALDNSFVKRRYLDVTYATISPSQKLDIYLPEIGEGPFPTIVFIHGGAFQGGDKAENQVSPFLYGLYRGFAVASLNYRLSGEAIFPAGLRDVKAAIRFLRANAERYHLDPRRFVAAGGSSGGNFAAMVCVTGNITEFDDDSLGYPGISSAVQAGVIWFPPTDFYKMDEQLAENGVRTSGHGYADSPESKYLGGALRSLPVAVVQAATPMTYIHSGVPPMLIQHGRKDCLVPYQQSVMLAEKIREIAGEDKVRLELLKYADHADLWFETVCNMQKVFAFLERSIEMEQV